MLFLDQARVLLESASVEVIHRIQGDLERAPQRIKPLLAHIAGNLFDPNLNVEQLKRACGVRDNSIGMHFHAAVGQPPGAYITDCRLTTASRLLGDTEMPVWQIGELVGYSGIHVFSRSFLRWSGQRPTAFRRKVRSEEEPRKPLPEDKLLRPETWRRALAGNLDEELAGTLIQRLLQLYPASHPEGATDAAEGVAEIDNPRDRRALEQARAEQTWRALVGRPLSEQRKVLRGESPFESPALFDLLCRKSREQGREDQTQGIELAQLALESIEGISARREEDLSGLRVRGWAWLANARRLAIDFAGAEKAFSMAECYLSEESKDPLAEGTLFFLEASLRWYQRRLDEALQLGRRAIVLSRQSGDQHLTAQVLILEAVIRQYDGAPEAAIPKLLEAVQLIDGQEDPYLKASAYYNLARCYLEAGRLEKALELLPQAKALCQNRSSRLLTLLFLWLEGMLDQEMGRLSSAEDHFRKTREGFLDLGRPEHAAAISLDLAVLYTIQGRPSEALPLAREILPLFEALDVHREALLALKVLRASLETEQLSLTVLKDIQHSLRKLRKDPTIHLDEPR